MYKTIIFDLGKVLVNFDFARGYRAIERLCPYAAAEIPKRLATTGLVEDFETGLVEPHDFVERMGRILDLTIGYEQFCSIWSSIFGETLIPESLLQILSARYRLLILSNTNAIHFEMIRQAYPLVRYFHDFVLSYEVKAMKPRREIYERALELARCAPGECFYTDDIAEYVEAARAVGIDAVQFRGAENLEQELRVRGIL